MQKLNVEELIVRTVRGVYERPSLPLIYLHFSIFDIAGPT
jgi:hypothetical protein